MNIQTLVNDLRSTIGDSNKQKFDNTRIITVIYKVINKLNKRYFINKDITYIKLLPMLNEYSLPSDCLNVYSYTQNGKEIAADSTLGADYDINKIGTKTLTKVFYNQSNGSSITTYPRLDEPALQYVIVDDSGAQVEPDFNTADHIILKDSIYFLFYNGSDIVIPDNYVVTEVTYDMLEVMYVKNYPQSPDLSSVDIPTQYYDAILYLSASILLSDDNRNDVRAKAADLYQRYNSELKVLSHDSMSTFNPAAFEIPYRTGFNHA